MVSHEIFKGEAAHLSCFRENSVESTRLKLLALKFSSAGTFKQFYAKEMFS